MIDTPVTLNQDEIYQIWYELIDPKQCNYNANFEKKKKKNLLEQCL